MKEEIRLYLEREFNFRNGDYDLAMFHIEQAMQLLVKARLLHLKGYFERSHSLRRLLSDLKQIEKSEEIEKFLKRRRRVLRDLERAYITARYYFEEFFEDEVKEAFEALDELRRLLWSA